MTMNHRGVSSRTAGLLLGAFLAAPCAAEPVPVVVFDFELIDTSLEGELNGPRTDETARLTALAEALRDAYRADPDHELIELDPADAAAVADGSAGACVGCVETLAAHRGAERAITGTVQKVSNLILNINVVVRDVGGPGRAVYSADIRSNTDQSWARGLSWIMRHRLGLSP